MKVELDDMVRKSGSLVAWSSSEAACIGFRTYYNAVIAPGRECGGVFADGRRVVEAWPSGRDPASVPRPQKRIDEPVLFIGTLHGCWGHCLTDDLRRLWFLPSLSGEEYRHFRLAYMTLIEGEELPPNLLQIFKLLGLDLHDAIRIDRPTEVGKCVVPDVGYVSANAGFSWGYPSHGPLLPTRGFDGIFDCVVRRAVSKRVEHPARKVYFSRTRCSRWDYGEEVIERAFASRGFEIIHPESLSLVGMLKILDETAVFASTEGSCSHNAVFLRKGTRAIIIRKSSSVNWYQMMINFMRELDVTFVRSAWSPALLRYERNDPVAGPFFLYVNSRLAKILGVRRCFPLGAFIRYVGWGFVLHWGHWLFSGLRRLRH